MLQLKNLMALPALLLTGCMALTCSGQMPQDGAGEGGGVLAGRPPADGGWPAGTLWYDELAGMEMVWVPAGSFVMGSSPVGEGRQANDSNEGPPHLVTISRGFWLGRCEVTQDQWEEVTGRQSPACFRGGHRPVENVSWEAVHRFFLDRLNELSGSSVYRLPTEAEWEYACRAGSGDPFTFGRAAARLDRYAWYDGNSENSWGGEGRTRPVGLLLANRWGLHDMHGNILEWCADRYGADYYRHSPLIDPPGPSIGRLRVSRGGSWFYPDNRCRSADRTRGVPNSRSSSVGFRLTRDAD